MYYRSHGYPYQKNINLPPNYGGNAFSNNKNEKSDSVEEPEEPLFETSNEASEEAISEKSENLVVNIKESHATEAVSLKQSSFLGKIGSEELLLLAIIFLISDSDGSDDILWLLILLLFIK